MWFLFVIVGTEVHVVPSMPSSHTHTHTHGNTHTHTHSRKHTITVCIPIIHKLLNREARLFVRTCARAKRDHAPKASK